MSANPPTDAGAALNAALKQLNLGAMNDLSFQANYKRIAEELKIERRFLKQEYKRERARYLTSLTRAAHQTDQRKDPRSLVLLEKGRLSWTLDVAQEVLAREHSTHQIYELSNLYVQPRAVTSQEAEADCRRFRIERPVGSAINRVLTVPSARDVLTRAINFNRHTRRAAKAMDCPADLAAAFLARAGDGHLPVLSGVIQAPMLRPDGSCLSAPGYDSATGFYFYSRESWETPPDRPSLADAEQAIETLRQPWREFKFTSNQGLAVAISAMLTGQQRRGLRSAPLHDFDAPVQGSGKSLGADVIAIFVTGYEATTVSLPDDETEMQKTLLTLLLSGAAVVNFDNVDCPLQSRSLATVLTQAFLTGRLLGHHKDVSVPTNTLFLATGNNLALRGDLTTRALTARIDQGVEHPEQSSFEVSDLRAYVAEHRHELVLAGLTLLRAHFLAGRPQPADLKPFGRFEQWSAEIRAALVWAGLADPCATRSEIVRNDLELENAEALLGAWFVAFGSNAKFLRDVIAYAAAEQERESVDQALQRLELRETMVAVAGIKDGLIDSQRLAYWCRNVVDRVIGGRVLRKERIVHSAALWKVESPG